MAAFIVGLCSFPVFNYGFSIPGFPGFSLPGIPSVSFVIDTSCPLN